MLDESKSYNIPVTIEDLLSNHRLRFQLNVDESGEEMDIKQHANYQEMVFTINKAESAAWMQGSLHYFWNKGKHNHDDFYFHQVVLTINRIQDEIHIDPASCPVNNIAYGVNLITYFNPADFIKDLIYHLGVPFDRMTEGNGKVCRHKQYCIKIYNKGLQFKLPYYVLRVEVRVNAMHYLQSKGINIWTLADLKRKEIHQLLAKDLLERFNEVLFYDSTIEIDKLSDKEQIILNKVRIPTSFLDESNKHKRTTLRRQYNHIFSQNVKRDWKRIVTPMIKSKLELLINGEEQLIDQFSGHFIPEGGTEMTHESLNKTIDKVLSGDFVQGKTLKEKPIMEKASAGHIGLLNPQENLIGNTKVLYGDFTKENAIGKMTNYNKVLNGDSEISNEHQGKKRRPLASEYPAHQFVDIDERIKQQTQEVWMVVHLHDVFDNVNLPEAINLPSYGFINDLPSFVQDHLYKIDWHYREPAYQEYYNRLIRLTEVLNNIRSDDRQKQYGQPIFNKSN